MARVKILLDKNETLDEVDSLLLKAMDLHTSGDVHDDEMFEDPAMADVNQRMNDIQKRIYDEMIEEIIMELDSEYLGK